MLRTGFIYDPLFLNHNTGLGHPERSERLTAAHALISKQAWYDSLIHLKPSPAAGDWLQTVHQPDYIQRARYACEAGQSRLDTPDVSISQRIL